MTTPGAAAPASQPSGPTRRAFLAVTGAALVGAGCGPALSLVGRRKYDLIIRGGTVFDGTGVEGMEADVALNQGRIAAVAPGLGESADVIYDARGMAVAPGFIDIHSHADGTLFDDPYAESVIRQGITTVIVGQDGASRAPSRDPEGRAQAVRRSLGADSRFDSMSRLLNALGRLPSAVNVASMVGLGTVRGVVVGDEARPATELELQAMEALVDVALDQGACGASSGLEYAPGSFAPPDELARLCRPLARRGLPYATHMRNEDDRLLDSLDESIAVARAAGCRLQLSHLKTQGPRNWGKIEPALARLESARAEGIDVAFDRYPYVAYATGLSGLFPNWSKDGGTQAFLARLVDPTAGPRIREETLAKVELIGGWDNVMLSGVASDADRAAEGKRLGEYSAALSGDPYDTAVGLLVRSRGSVGMVGFAMSEENIARFLAHPLGMVCSDGGAFAVEGTARRGHPHPRAFGAFPRVLARYVRERKALTLAQAIHKMTGFPASRVRLADRGRLAANYAADVVVFDPARVEDRATFADPFHYPAGINLVVVNGSIALRDGVRGDKRRGRAVRGAG